MQQLAVVGHAISDIKIWEAVDGLRVNAGTLSELAEGARAIGLTRTFVAEHHRLPSDYELVGLAGDSDTMAEMLAEAMVVKDRIGFEPLAPLLKAARAIAIVQEAYTDLGKVGETGDADKVIELMEQTVVAYRAVDGQGAAYTTHDSDSWGVMERRERDENVGKTLFTGVRFLDEIMDGVAPNDLVIVAAKTGVGKSQLLAEIARFVSKRESDDEIRAWLKTQGVRSEEDFDVQLQLFAEVRRRLTNGEKEADVRIWLKANTGMDPAAINALLERFHKAFLLALEAYPGEMQRRLKWPIIVKLWRKDHPHGCTCGTCNRGENLDWVKFSHSRYQEILKPYEDAAQAEFSKKYGTLRALYKNSSNFDIREMERAIVRASKDSDLILLDHLHYVDTDSDDRNVNEYQMQKKIVQKLREITLSGGKPIIAAAHFSKPEVGRFAPLLPPMEKIMGSSDISKIATHVLLLGDTSGLEPDVFPLPDIPGTERMIPTLFRLSKSRTAGSERTNYVAVCFYDRAAGQYLPTYVLGWLRNFGTKWAPVYQEDIPYWAVSAVRIPRPSPEGGKAPGLEKEKK
jgi:hypothetical protein